jgi:SAM-dependent methyltransferase
MNRTDIINHLAMKINAKSYLEIGVYDGSNIKSINIPKKVGVDPDENSPATHHLPSDVFFSSNQEKFDLIFVDGLHHADQVERDVSNALKFLNEGGVIVCHDSNPPTEQHQIIPYQGGAWNGDVWKAVVKFRRERTDLKIYTVDTDFGCTVIERGSQETLTDNDELTYTNLEKNRAKWLNLISVQEFYDKITGGTPLKSLLDKFIEDPTDPENNWELALYYHSIGHTATAVSYYLRTAERAKDDLLKYEALLRASMCFESQGCRSFSVKGLLQHAVSLMPRRPEAYYMLSRYYEKAKDDGHWNDCYMISSIGDMVANKAPLNLKTKLSYPGEYAILFQKALSSWHCGLCDESRDLFRHLLQNYELDSHHKDVALVNLKMMNAL